MAAEAGLDAVGALIELGRFDQALPLAEQMVAADPGDARAQEVLGRCLLGLGRPWDAVGPADAARAVAPADARTQRFAAFAHLCNAEPVEAAVGAAEARRLDPADPLNHWIVAEAELAGRRIGPARDAARECIRLAPGLAAGHRLLCRVAAASGEWKASEGHGRSAVELDPADGANWAALAMAFRGRGRLVAALRCFSAAGRLGAPGEEVRQAMVGTLLTLTLVTVLGVAAPAYALSAWIDGRLAVMAAVAVIGAIAVLTMRRLPSPARHLVRQSSRVGPAALRFAGEAISGSRPQAEQDIRVFGAKQTRQIALLMGLAALGATVLGLTDLFEGGAGLITGPILVLPGLFFGRHAYHMLRAARRKAQ